MKPSSRILRRFRFAALLGLALVLANALTHPFEPRYQGKRITAWAEQILFFTNPESDEQDRSKAKAATDAIRHVGPRALSAALNYCEASDSALTERFKNWINAKRVLRIHFLSDYEYQQRGIAIFQALGPAGKPAISSLIKSFRQKDQGVCNAASAALLGIGIDSVPPLKAALSNANGQIRMGAARTLGSFQTNASTAASALLQCLKDENSQVRANAALSLADIGEAPEMVVPALLLCLQDGDLRVRQNSAMALERLRQFPETVVPALLNYLESETNTPVPDPIVVSGLGRFGTNARPWSPILVQMIQSNRFGFFSHSAWNALEKIDPETAEQLVSAREFIRTNAPPQLPRVKLQGRE